MTTATDDKTAPIVIDTEPSGAAVGTGLLVVAGIAAAGLGLLSLSQATSGVGLLCAACFLGMLARLVQARGHQAQVRHLLAKGR